MEDIPSEERSNNSGSPLPLWSSALVQEDISPLTHTLLTGHEDNISNLNYNPSATIKVFHHQNNAANIFQSGINVSLPSRARKTSGTLARYSCKYCSKVFIDKSKWTRHLLAHTGEKPFACHLCSRPFSRKDNLQTHLKEVHKSDNKQSVNLHPQAT